MASTKEIRALITLAGKIDPSLQSAMLKATNQQNKLTNNAKNSGKTLSQVGSIAKGVFLGNIFTKGASLAIDGIKNMSTKGVELASNLSEVQNVVNTTFGGNAKQINDWSKTALNAFGLSELQAKQYTGTLGAMLKSSGVASQYSLKMSKDLAGLSGDFASFYNLDGNEAFDKIRSGISGETEPLKQLGINMSVANLQAFALSKGIKTQYSNMDQASQMMLRYNYLMSVSKDAQGDFAKTLDTSYANQKRLFDTKIQETLAKITVKTMPLLTRGLQFVNSLIDKVDVDKIGGGIEQIANNASVLLKNAVRVFNFTSNNWSVISPMILGIVSAMTAWKAITIGMGVYNTIMGAIRLATGAATVAQVGLNAAVLANPMTWIVIGVAAAIGVLVAGIYLLWKNWDSVSAFMVGIWQNNVLPFFQGVGTFFSGLWDGIVNGIKNGFFSATNWVIEKFNWLIDKVNYIPGVEIPLIPTVQTSGNGMEQYAKGGFANKPSIFGEAGPEAAIPLRRTPRSLALLDKTAGLLGVKQSSDGSVVVNLTINAPGANAQEIKKGAEMAKDYIYDVIDEYLLDKRRPSFG